MLKKGAHPDHVREEDVADRAYRAAGIPVPASKVYETPEGPVKLSQFHKDLTSIGDALDSMKPKEKKALLDQAGQGFALDCILGNWDVAGQDLDNMMVDKSGTVIRIDNGGSLRYRAQGAPKADSAFGPVPSEFAMMRDPAKGASRIFGHLTDKDISEQVARLAPHRAAILKEMPEAIRNRVAQRFDWAVQKYAPTAATSASAQHALQSPAETSPAWWQTLVYFDGRPLTRAGMFDALSAAGVPAPACQQFLFSAALV